MRYIETETLDINCHFNRAGCIGVQSSLILHQSDYWNAQGLHLRNEQLFETLELREQARSHFWNWYTTAACSTKDTTVVGGEKKERQHQAASID